MDHDVPCAGAFDAGESLGFVMPIWAAICDIWVAQNKFWKLPQSGACEGITMCGASVVFNLMLIMLHYWITKVIP